MLASHRAKSKRKNRYDPVILYSSDCHFHVTLKERYFQVQKHLRNLLQTSPESITQIFIQQGSLPVYQDTMYRTHWQRLVMSTNTQSKNRYKYDYKTGHESQSYFLTGSHPKFRLGVSSVPCDALSQHLSNCTVTAHFNFLILQVSCCHLLLLSSRFLVCVCVYYLYI